MVYVYARAASLTEITDGADGYAEFAAPGSMVVNLKDAGHMSFMASEEAATWKEKEKRRHRARPGCTCQSCHALCHAEALLCRTLASARGTASTSY